MALKVNLKAIVVAGLLCASGFASAQSARHEEYVYHDDYTQWVLGQTEKITVNGVVSDQAVYNDSASPTELRSFGRLKQTISYNADGTISGVVDGKDNATTFGNWKRGVPRVITFADGSTQSASVDDNGWILSVTQETGSTTSYAYDQMGRISNTDYPVEDLGPWNSTATTFSQILVAEYGIPSGHWKEVVSTGASRKETYFDALWRPVVVREYDANNAGATVRFTRFGYNDRGQKTFESYPGTTDSLTEGNWTSYDSLGRVVAYSQDSDTGLLVTTTEYLSGLQTRTTDPLGHQVTTTYQAFDEPSYDAPTLIQTQGDARTIIERDVFGKPQSITRSNDSGSVAVTRSYVYQADQQLCKALEPESGATVYGYDAAGNLINSAAGLDVQAFSSLTDCQQDAAWSSGRVVARNYDARNRLTNLIFPKRKVTDPRGEGDQVWVYTPDGLPSEITTYNASGNDAVVNAYGYNHRRLLVSEDMTQPGASAATSLDYVYDTNGNLAMHVYPSGLGVDYAPNALGQPSKAGSYATGVSYYPNGAIKQFTYGNGIVHTMTQNGRQLPARSTDGAIMDMAYGFDKDGNVSSITDYVDGRQTRSMTYDKLNRLLSTDSVMFGGDNKAAFTYDALDNLKTFKVGSAINYQYAYNNKQQLETVTNVSTGAAVLGIGYDLQGNMDNRSGQLFKFDYGNRMREATGKESYRYDANGRRVLNDSSSQGKIFSLYGQDGVLRRQQDQRTGKTSEYIYLGGSLVARVVNAQALPVPTTSVPASSSNGLYTVSWTTASDITRYEVEEKAGGTGAWSGVYSGTGTSLVVSGKANGAYSYRARTCLNTNCGAWSNEATIAVQLIPASAPGITSPATAIGGNFTVTWTSVANTTAYKLEQQLDAGAWSEVYSGTALNQSFIGLAAGTYKYRVHACSGSGCGDYSATTQTITIYAPTQPGAPSAPASSANGAYTVAWSAVANASEYRLEESVNGGTWTQIITGGGTSYSVSGKASASYGYRLRACNVAGCSGYSGTATTTVLLPPTGQSTVTAPGSSSTGSYTVSWTAVSAAVTYQLQEKAGSAAWSSVYTGASTSSAISGKANGSYQYQARGCNASGCGPWSGIATTAVSLPPPVPAAPTGLSGTFFVKNAIPPLVSDIKITWNAVAGATYYTAQAQGISYSGSATSAHGTYTGPPGGINGTPVTVKACNAIGCGPAVSATIVPRSAL